MLTPCVLALAFANGMVAACAYPYAALIGALQIPKIEARDGWLLLGRLQHPKKVGLRATGGGSGPKAGAPKLVDQCEAIH
jgi:hypothetical protein